MEARRFARHVMAVSPFALVLTMGIHRHTTKPHEFLTYTKPQEMRMDAYRSVFRNATAALSIPNSKNGTQLKKVACQWADESETGKLRPLFPAFQEESFDDGPRAQVIQVWMRVGALLESQCTADQKAGRFNKSAEDCMLLIRYAEAFKGSDFITECAGDGYERRAMNNVDRWFSKADFAHQESFKEILTSAIQDHGDLRKLCQNARDLHQDFDSRHDGDDSENSDLGKFLQPGPDGSPTASTYFVQETQSDNDVNHEIQGAQRGDSQVHGLMASFLKTH